MDPQDSNKPPVYRRRLEDKLDSRTRPAHDAFRRYSDDVTRLKALLHKDDDEDFDLDAFVRRHYATDKVNVGQRRGREGAIDAGEGGNPQDGAASCPRKSRITFELHPALILEDALLWDFEGQEGAADPLEGFERR